MPDLLYICTHTCWLIRFNAGRILRGGSKHRCYRLRTQVLLGNHCHTPHLHLTRFPPQQVRPGAHPPRCWGCINDLFLRTWNINTIQLCTLDFGLKPSLVMFPRHDWHVSIESEAHWQHELSALYAQSRIAWCIPVCHVCECLCALFQAKSHVLHKYLDDNQIPCACICIHHLVSYWYYAQIMHMCK
jgi:hypothetical protein